MFTVYLPPRPSDRRLPIPREARPEEVIPGVMKRGWIPPESWGQPVTRPPYWFKGCLVRPLYFPQGPDILQEVEDGD